MTKKDKATINAIKRIKIATAKTLFCPEAMYEGIKLWVNDPSANMRRKRLGNLNAIKKMSLHILAPKTEVIKTSLPRPVTREMRMPKELENTDLNIDNEPFLKIYVSLTDM